MAGPGMSPKKKSGDSSFNNNKKRRKNETPPPSRRPQGLPNVPPPRPVTPPVKTPSIRVGPQVKDVIIVNDIMEEKIELEEVKEREVEKLEKTGKVDKILENGISPEKRSAGKSVHKQLRKLQEMHKNKLSKTSKHDRTDINKGVTLNSEESPSPILSILRTSFVNEHKIKTHDITEDGELEIGKKRKQKGSKKTEIPAKRSREDTVSPAASRLSERSCRLLLQSPRNSKLRLSAWKEIRNVTGKNAKCFISGISFFYVQRQHSLSELAIVPTRCAWHEFGQVECYDHLVGEFLLNRIQLLQILSYYRMRQKGPTFKRLLLPEYVSNDVLQDLIE